MPARVDLAQLRPQSAGSRSRVSLYPADRLTDRLGAALREAVQTSSSPRCALNRRRGLGDVDKNHCVGGRNPDEPFRSIFCREATRHALRCRRSRHCKSALIGSAAGLAGRTSSRQKMSGDRWEPVECDRGDACGVGARRQEIDRVAYGRIERQRVGMPSIENIGAVASRAGDWAGRAAIARRADPLIGSARRASRRDRCRARRRERPNARPHARICACRLLSRHHRLWRRAGYGSSPRTGHAAGREFPR